MQNNDFQWYLDNFYALHQKYGNKFIAIKNQKVLGIYDTCAEGVKETVKTEPIGTFIVQKCGEDSSAYTNHIVSLFV